MFFVLLERYWQEIVIFSLVLVAVFYIGSGVSEELFSTSYKCGSAVYDRGRGALKEHGVSTRCPELVVRRKCNNQALSEYKERAEEHGMDSFYGRMYRKAKKLMPNPYVLTIYYGVGGDRYKAFNVFDGEFYPSRVPPGVCENAPGDLRWRGLTGEEEDFMDENNVTQDFGNGSLNGSVNSSGGGS